jgi:uncharacterized protein (TIGR03118 family)
MFRLDHDPATTHHPRRRDARPARPARPGRWQALERLEDRQLLAAALSGTSVPLSPAPVEGVSFTGIVAKFTDADMNTDPAAYAVAIDWGDGRTSKGTVAVDPQGGFDVSGTHTYSAPGAFRVIAQVGDQDSDATSIATTNVVGEAPISATGATINATRDKALSNVVVATFTDADRALKASAFSAAIDWGDGRTSAGKVVAVKRGGFRVLGSHTYATSGTFSVQVAIRQGAPGGPTQFFTPSNLVSDGAVPADHVDALFVNTFGLAARNPDDFWNADNGKGTSALIQNAGNINPVLPFVTVPPPAGSNGPSTPTGIVFNPLFDVQGSTSFVVSDGTNSGTSEFMFATEDGTISGWSAGVNGGGAAISTHATLAVDDSAAGAVFKGLALFTMPAGGALPAGPYLFATDFHNGVVDAFDQNFKPVTLPAGAFRDPTLPAGFAPFGIQSLGGNLLVTYAMQDAARHDDVAGPGNGFVDVFSPSGALIQRLGGPGVQPEMNSPWGITQAPPDFGTFSNDILVGNFGDSHVSVFDPATGAFLGQLNDANGQPLALDGGFQGADNHGLWGMLAFNNGNPAGPTSTLFFDSGINDEKDGLFGSLTFSTVATANANSTASVVPHGARMTAMA